MLRRLTFAAPVAVACAISVPAAMAADEPVRLNVNVPSIVARGAPVPLSVSVAADPGALNTATAPLRLRVRFSPLCTSTFAGTAGAVPIDARLPAAGAAAYAATLRGKAPVPDFRGYSVCAFVEEEGDDRLFATNFDGVFQATRGCTSATDAEARRTAELRRARRAFAHARGRRRRARLRRRVQLLQRRERAAARAQRAACGG